MDIELESFASSFSFKVAFSVVFRSIFLATVYNGEINC